MRRTILVLAVVAAVTLAAGCSDSPENVGGQAGPVGTAAPTFSPSSASSPSPSMTSAPAASPSSTPSSKPSRTSTALVLGPTGYGKVKIGMSLDEAAATGQLKTVDRVEEGCGYSKLKTADVKIAHSTDRGVVYIPGEGRTATPEGIRVGSTLAQVKEAYSDFTIPDIAGMVEFEGDGAAYAGTKDKYTIVHYRFDFRDSKVFQLGLEHERQNCYE
ncbi:hypothetical protein [Actinoplanes sp. NPDC049802]|uniref:hypothetical protein n=1 Tax=Actinoplanes sp. NPDC049802 TaxID=3154742 RepID=UPI0033E86118